MDNGCKIWRKRVPHNIRLPAAIASLAYSLVASQVMVQMCDGPFLWPHIHSLQPNRTMSLSSRGSICPSLVELACNMDAGHHCGERLCELFRGSQRDIPTDRTHTPGRGWCPSFFQADAQWPHSLLHAVKLYGGMSPKWARSVSLHVKISLLCISSQCWERSLVMSDRVLLVHGWEVVPPAEARNSAAVLLPDFTFRLRSSTDAGVVAWRILWCAYGGNGSLNWRAVSIEHRGSLAPPLLLISNVWSCVGTSGRSLTKVQRCRCCWQMGAQFRTTCESTSLQLSKKKKNGRLSHSSSCKVLDGGSFLHWFASLVPAQAFTTCSGESFCRCDSIPAILGETVKLMASFFIHSQMNS